jgi:predicted DNA-binding protein
MNKEFQVALRMSEEELKKLEELASRTFRTKSDMIRFLVEQEYQKASEVSGLYINGEPIVIKATQP